MFNFYFDEAFHDQKITNIDGVLNSMTENAIDNYIGVFLGFPQEQISETENIFLNFDKKYRKIFTIKEKEELKSRQIKLKQYKYGLKSFNQDQFDFYLEYFTLINRFIPKIQIVPISKIEFVIRNFTKYLQIKCYEYNEISFVYSVTKFIYTYHTKELINSLFKINDIDSADNFKKKLIELLKIVISNESGIKRKEIEIEALIQLTLLLEKSYFSNINPITSLTFSYTPNFDGLSRFLNESKINKENVALFIDKHKATYNEACKFKFFSIEQINSADSVFIRMSDFLAGFIGKFIYNICNDSSLKEDEIVNTSDIIQNDLTTKRILSEEWFSITEKQFDLYKVIHSILSDRRICNIYYPLFVDQIILFESLLEYFASYDTFEEFINIPSKMHSEYYNTLTCINLESFYINF